MSAKYALIAEHHRTCPTCPTCPVELMCRLLGVSRSGFYTAQQRARGPASPRQQRDAALRLRVGAVHEASGRTYGAPRVHAQLQADGEHVSRKHVARLLHELGRTATRKQRRVRTTDSRHAESVAPNHLARHFRPAPAVEVNRVWVADVTYVPTRHGWLYLAVVLDLASRRVVGWALGTTLETALVLAALQMALGQRRPAPGLLHHSDRGAQYASAAYQAVLRAHAIIPSMSRKGDCWDNAVAESFFATLEHELLATHDFPTREVARQAITTYIALWYNARRRHSTLGYHSPIEHERQLAATRHNAA